MVVTLAKIPAKLVDPNGSAEVDAAGECPVVVIVNNGHFTITNLDARFAKDTALYPARQMEYYSDYPALPKELVAGLVADPAVNMLPPGVAGMRFSGGAMVAGELHGIAPIVRWTDRWALVGST